MSRTLEEDSIIYLSWCRSNCRNGADKCKSNI